MANQQPNLPPGFRFHPTDEELIVHYLERKLTSLSLPAPVIADVNIYKFDPWELPDKAVFGEKEWYYFSPRVRKYPNGGRPNRSAVSGYWKATGTDKVIVNSKTGENIGIKKVLVFYKGKPPSGVKTRWIMHEFRLADDRGFNQRNRAGRLAGDTMFMSLDEWVLCRIYHKPEVMPAIPGASSSSDFEEETSRKALENSINSRSFSNLLDTVDLSFLRSILQDDNVTDSAQTPPPSSQVNVTLHSQATRLPVPNFETGQKRERPIGDAEIVTTPSKKFVSCYRGSTPDLQQLYSLYKY